MTLWLYRALAAPLMTLSLPVLAIFNRKVRRGLKLRMQRRVWPKFTVRPIWIHAASGEFEYAKSIIRSLKQSHPEIPIVVTYFSPTFALVVENFPGVDFALPLPLDLPGPCSSFLKRLQPRALWLARTDFWPEMLSQCRQRQIPVHVFSYTQKQMNWKALTRFRLNLVNTIACVSKDDQDLIESLPVKASVQVLGDTRYDQVRYRLDHPKTLPESLRPVSKPCLVAGSTWTEDEKVLISGLSGALKSGLLQMILVPHEPTEAHVSQLKAELRFHGLTSALFSEQATWSDKHVLIVDKVGLLAELYLWGDIAFVGGSFKRSVHSVMEPLGAGCLTLVGPFHSGNREALEFKKVDVLGCPAVQVVDGADRLSETVQAILSQPSRLKLSRPALTRIFDQRQGATRRLIETLQSELN